jgi:hypothetical protein
MTQEEGKRICPHCGAENPKSAIVTTCQNCLQPLGEAEEPAEEAAVATQPRRDVAEPAPPPAPAAVEPAPSATGEYWSPALRMAALGVALGSVVGLVVGGSVLGGQVRLLIGAAVGAVLLVQAARECRLADRVKMAAVAWAVGLGVLRLAGDAWRIGGRPPMSSWWMLRVTSRSPLLASVSIRDAFLCGCMLLAGIALALLSARIVAEIVRRWAGRGRGLVVVGVPLALVAYMIVRFALGLIVSFTRDPLFSGSGLMMLGAMIVVGAVVVSVLLGRRSMQQDSAEWKQLLSAVFQKGLQPLKTAGTAAAAPTRSAIAQPDTAQVSRPPAPSTPQAAEAPPVAIPSGRPPVAGHERALVYVLVGLCAVILLIISGHAAGGTGVLLAFSALASVAVIGGVVWVVRKRVAASFYEVVVDPVPSAALGETFAWGVTVKAKRSVTIGRLTFTLRCFEHAISRGSADTHYQRKLAEHTFEASGGALQTGEEGQFRADVTIPATAVPSHSSNSNFIEWTAEVRAPVPGWCPDIREVAWVRVRPAMAPGASPPLREDPHVPADWLAAASLAAGQAQSRSTWGSLQSQEGGLIHEMPIVAVGQSRRLYLWVQTEEQVDCRGVWLWVGCWIHGAGTHEEIDLVPEHLIHEGPLLPGQPVGCPIDIKVPATGPVTFIGRYVKCGWVARVRFDTPSDDMLGDLGLLDWRLLIPFVVTPDRPE